MVLSLQSNRVPEDASGHRDRQFRTGALNGLERSLVDGSRSKRFELEMPLLGLTKD
jgi:hypothetical protein